jgi:hypothetical protein
MTSLSFGFDNLVAHKLITKRVAKGKAMTRNFGGRPVTRKPVPGRRTNLSIVVPLTLKRQIERAAKKRGWSLSSEATHRLLQSFETAKPLA